MSKKILYIIINCVFFSMCVGCSIKSDNSMVEIQTEIINTEKTQEYLQNKNIELTQIEDNILPKEDSIEEIIVPDGKVLELSKNDMLEHVHNRSVDGNGYIRWEGWKARTDENILSGNLYIPFIEDMVYTSMKLPSEVQTCMSARVNPFLGEYKPDGYVNAVGIGSIYQVVDSELPEIFDICIGKFATFILKDGKDAQWEVLDEHIPLNSKKYFRVAKLPWSLGISSRVPEEKIQYNDEYVRFNLVREDLTDQVLHFYGEKVPCVSEEIVGLVTIFEVWSETEGIEGKLSCAIGIDQRNEEGTISQAFSGRNYMVTNEPRLIIGHNMPDEVYAKCVAEGKSPDICLELFMGQ